ncbi:IS3 family transposase [Staphylococcus sp. 27_4_6_LY]|nr:IS3 family transposase [Staphylococcus durrellii]
MMYNYIFLEIENASTTSFHQLQQAIQKYIIFYNNEGIKLKFKGLFPKNFRKQTFKILLLKS